MFLISFLHTFHARYGSDGAILPTLWYAARMLSTAGVQPKRGRGSLVLAVVLITTFIGVFLLVVSRHTFEDGAFLTDDETTPRPPLPTALVETDSRRDGGAGFSGTPTRQQRPNDDGGVKSSSDDHAAAVVHGDSTGSEADRDSGGALGGQIPALAELKSKPPTVSAWRPFDLPQEDPRRVNGTIFSDEVAYVWPNRTTLLKENPTWRGSGQSEESSQDLPMGASAVTFLEIYTVDAICGRGSRSLQIVGSHNASSSSAAAAPADSTERLVTTTANVDAPAKEGGVSLYIPWPRIAYMSPYPLSDCPVVCNLTNDPKAIPAVHGYVVDSNGAYVLEPYNWTSNPLNKVLIALNIENIEGRRKELRKGSGSRYLGKGWPVADAGGAFWRRFDLVISYQTGSRIPLYYWHWAACREPWLASLPRAWRALLRIESRGDVPLSNVGSNGFVEVGPANRSGVAQRSRRKGGGGRLAAPRSIPGAKGGEVTVASEHNTDSRRTVRSQQLHETKVQKKKKKKENALLDDRPRNKTLLPLRPVAPPLPFAADWMPPPHDDTFIEQWASEVLRRKTASAPILFFARNCDFVSHRRMTFVKALMRYIKVDAIGKCLINKEQDSVDGCGSVDRRRRKACFISRYPFYLAVENSISLDYVTEKVYEPMLVGSVPIYLGAPNAEMLLPTAHSAVIATDFASVKHLAGYIKCLLKTPRLYGEYLAWRTRAPLPWFARNVMHVDTDASSSLPPSSTTNQGGRREHHDLRRHAVRWSRIRPSANATPARTSLYEGDVGAPLCAACVEMASSHGAPSRDRRLGGSPRVLENVPESSRGSQRPYKCA